jgi:interferon gamma-inducible protein 30
VHFPYIECIESDSSTDFTAVGKSCAAKNGIDFNAIQTCMTSSQGNALEHQMGLQTEALQPAHQYVVLGACDF